ncbi:hypothetical protein BXZ70DRAFT_1004272 [Cristinia sonorae]|uniref:HIG1 domain-containing protein n=1 Tax=Cristinia sonorae TaxID=1940300 RepID=A0A8K0UXB8_9AGAR|nr:hypothetical protein BXZ70DRAFT_1004272 [Cristinia sonorae]
MKITTQEQRDGQMRATVIGGAQGFVGGLAVAGPASYLLNKRWAYYRSLPPSLKALGIIIVVVPSFVISAERAGLRYEREQWQVPWTGVGKTELDSVAARQQAKWESMAWGERIKDVAARHQYGLIGGGWAASMVVQARMWAQGLTIGVMIAAGALTHAHRAKAQEEGAVRHLEADHSWRDIVAEEERLKAEGK